MNQRHKKSVQRIVRSVNTQKSHDHFAIRLSAITGGVMISLVIAASLFSKRQDIDWLAIYVVFGLMPFFTYPVFRLVIRLVENSLFVIYGFFNGRADNAGSAILIPLALLLGTYAWLLGFRIRITSDRFEYRDGLWRWHRCPFNEISGVKHTWVEFKNLGRTLKMPRMVVSRHDFPKKPILVNTKPFSRTDLKRVEEMLNVRS